MAEKQILTLTIDVEELLTGFMPKMAKEFMKISGAAEEMAGTEFSMVFEVSGAPYSYVAKNGTEIDAKAGDLENPLVRIRMTLEDMQKLADMKNADMLIGQQGQLNKQKYNALTNLKGSLTMNLNQEDGSVATIQVVLNGAESPACALTMDMEAAKGVATKEANPVNLFMSGQLKIDGDMAFAMGIQPLFT